MKQNKASMNHSLRKGIIGAEEAKVGKWLGCSVLAVFCWRKVLIPYEQAQEWVLDCAVHSGEAAALPVPKKWVIGVPAFLENVHLLGSVSSSGVGRESGDVLENPVCSFTKFSLTGWFLSLFPFGSSSVPPHQTGLPFASCADLQVLLSSAKRNKTAWFLQRSVLEATQFLFPGTICPRRFLVVPGALILLPGPSMHLPSCSSSSTHTAHRGAMKQRSKKIFHRH